MTRAAGAKESDPFGWLGATLDGKYRIDAVVGEGGFGVVYAGHHLGFDQPVAIKCLKLDGLPPSRRSVFLKGFISEGRIMFRLSQDSPSIVRALDVGAQTSPSGAWTPYLVLEWIHGVTLEENLTQRASNGLGGRSLAEALELLDPVARALDVAHETGVAHRDVKPGNLLLTDVRGNRTMKILDFGVAKTMSTAHAAGATTLLGLHAFTAAYGAPEQQDPGYGDTGPWTDVFALALVFVEAVAGRRALDGADPEQLRRQATDLVRRPTLRSLGVACSDELDRVLNRALAVDPRNRYRRAGEFWNTLMAAAPAVPATLRDPSPAMAAPATLRDPSPTMTTPATLRDPSTATAPHSSSSTGSSSPLTRPLLTPHVQTKPLQPSTQAQPPMQALLTDIPPSPRTLHASPLPGIHIPPPPPQSVRTSRTVGSGTIAVALVSATVVLGVGALILGLWLYEEPLPPIPLASATAHENPSPPPEAPNDGTDPKRPVLPLDEVGYLDKRGGRDWGDKCWDNIKARRWGWAKAECDEAMKLAPTNRTVRAQLLYNQGLIARQAGDIAQARQNFIESLRLREHKQVREALDSL